jgi:gliding motility-associated-like protein
MKIFDQKITKYTTAFLTLFLTGQSFAQCEFTGLDSIYCISDPAVTMSPVDPGVSGTFSGPGVTDDTFDPADAGIGTHTIYFEVPEITDGDKYYIKSSIGNPWGSTTNQTTMDNAFGPGGWTLEAFETIDVGAVFVPSTSFVFIDGSDGQASELAAFLTPITLLLIEDWVDAGGRLLINSAPNEGGDINFGFDGTTLNYTGWSTLTPDVIAPDVLHPALAGPMLPTDPDMDGNYYAHAYIDGVGYTNVLVDEFDASNVILAEKCWGSGRVMMGGMTTFNWHDPDPHAEHFRANIMTYLNETPCEGVVGCIDSMVVTVVDAPDVTVEDMGEQCVPVELDDVLLTLDDGGTDDNIIEWYTVPPDSLGDPADVWPGGPIGEGDVIYVVYGSPSSGCFDVELVEITFNPPYAGLDSLMSVCNSGVGGPYDANTMLVDADPGGIWEDLSVIPTAGFNPGTGIFDPTGVDAGVYTFGYITAEADPCPNDTALMIFTVEEQPTAGLDNDGEICNEPGFTFDLNTLLAGHDAGGYWEEITPTGGLFDPASGIFLMDGMIGDGDYDFRYIVLGSDPCVNDTSIFTITVHPLPDVDAGPDQQICDGDETTVSATISGGFVIMSEWDMGVEDGVPFTPGVGLETYTVTAADANGCVNSDDLDIDVKPLPEISFSATEVIGCNPLETEFILNSSETIDHIDWIFGDGGVADGVTTTDYEYTYENSGNFAVTATVTDIFGCVSTVTYTDYILVEEMPVADFDANRWAVYTDDTEVSFTNTSEHADEYVWDFGDGSGLTDEEDPYHVFPFDQNEEQTYPVELVATNYLGCTDSITKYIHVRDLLIFYIPNTFTPDGNGYNDSFKPVFESGYDPYDFHLTIFNRWGEIVFESYNAAAGWDGTYGDAGLVDDGVYIWQVEFKEVYTDKRQTYNGHVTVIK